MGLIRRIISSITSGPGRGGPPARPQEKIPNTPEARELWGRVSAVQPWFHSIDLGNGVTTPGIKTPETLQMELASLRLPDLAGKSVLDVGAWDGFYSFESERRGAARVVALDRHVWALDWEAKRRYKAECKEEGIPPEPYDRVPHLWRFDELPGKRGFDLAHEALRSRVEVVVGDLMNVDPEALGRFDVVLYLGGLYHMESPPEALRRLWRVTKELAVIETEAVEFGGFGDRAMCEYFPPRAKLHGDPSNFWAPNATALVGLCEAAGFGRVEVLTKPAVPAKGQVTRYRLIAHAFA